MMPSGRSAAVLWLLEENMSFQGPGGLPAAPGLPGLPVAPGGCGRPLGEIPRIKQVINPGESSASFRTVQCFGSSPKCWEHGQKSCGFVFWRFVGIVPGISDLVSSGLGPTCEEYEPCPVAKTLTQRPGRESYLPIIWRHLCTCGTVWDFQEQHEDTVD